MKPEFPEVVLTALMYNFRGQTFHMSASNGDIQVSKLDAELPPTILGENVIEYWVGVLMFWYDQSWDNPWTEDDYWVAAHVCCIKRHVLDAAALESICGITKQYGIGPRSIASVDRALKSYEYKVNALSEGAD